MKNLGIELNLITELYKGLFNHATIGFYQTTPEGNIISVNPALLKMLNYKSLNDLLKRDDYKKVIENLGEAINFVSDWFTSNGTIITLKEGAYAVKDENGKIIHYDVLVENMTEQKKNKEAMLRLTKSIGNSSDIIINTDIHGTITYVNQSFCKLYGYSEDEIVGKVTPRILKSGKQPENLYKHYWDSLLQKKSVKGLQFVNKCKNGQLVNVEVSADPIIDDNDQIVGFIGIQRNITQRIKNEKIQSIVLNIANMSQSTSDLGEIMKFIQGELGRIVDTSNFYVALYNEEDDSINLPYYSDEIDDSVDFLASDTMTGLVIKQQKSLLLKEQDIAKLREQKIIDAVDVYSKSWLGVPLKIKNKTIGVFVIQSYTDENAFSDDDVEILEIISHQISVFVERKLYEEQLITAIEKSKESDKLKSAFLANLSHEVRTPLNGIMGFAELLKQPDLTVEKQLKFIEVIQKSGTRLLNVITDIVDISKIESGLMTVDIKESNIKEQIESIYTFFKPEFEKKGIKFFVNNTLLEEDLIVKTDPEKICAIFTNLIKNALKFTNNGSVLFGYEIKDEYLEFYVKDTGVGIPKDKHEDIFLHFIQADISNEMAFQGTGLGLSITKAYVELLGGKIWVESEVENLAIGKAGTSAFYFTIPGITTTTTKTSSQNDESSSKFDEQEGNLKILIAEDDEASALYLSILVEEFSSELLMAKNGLEAVEIYKNNPDIDLILMDMQMPYLNGYEATSQIRQLNKNVKIIAQTAFAHSFDRQKVIDAGCNDYIAKPINKDKLTEMIIKHLS